MSFSVHNSAGQLIEKSQEVLQPALSSVDQRAHQLNQQGQGSTQPSPPPPPPPPSHVALYWGSYWHMHTPLQNLEAGSFVLIEVRDGSAEENSTSSGNSANNTTFYTRYALDYSTINAVYDQVLPLAAVANGLAASRRTMLTHPVAPPLVSAHSRDSGTVVSLPKTSQLTVDCVLHRKDRLVAFEQIMATYKE